MGQEPESDKNASGIAHAPKRKWGYDSVQVDAFLERAHKLYEGEGIQLTQNDIQKVSFDLVKGGYVIAQVDAALARLERAVVDKQTTWEISQHGRVAWKGQTEALFRELNDHAQREEGERFKPGEPKKPSYDRKQVDRIIDQCLMKAADSLDITKMGDDDAKKLADLNSRTVANVIFTQRKGKRGYDERQVDYYLASCVQLLTRLESYDRVADFVGDPASAATAGDDASETELLTPVYAAPVSVDSQVIAESQSAIHSNESFDFLNKEEHAIFKAPAASPVTTPVAPQGTQSAPLPAVGMAGGNAASQPAAAQPAVAQPAKTSIFAPGGISAPTASAAGRRIHSGHRDRTVQSGGRRSCRLRACHWRRRGSAGGGALCSTGSAHVRADGLPVCGIISCSAGAADHFERLRHFGHVRRFRQHRERRRSAGA